MDPSQGIRQALSRAGRTPDDDVVEELVQHARAMYERARAEGESRDDALRRVDVQIAVWADDAAVLRRPPARPAVIEPPPVGRSSWVEGLAADARYALRLLRRRWGLTLLVVSTMAIGLGATATVFSVVYGELVSPLPWTGADRLVVVKEARAGNAPHFGDVSNGTYLAWREAPTSLEGLAAWSPRTASLSGHGEAERITIASVTADLFPLLGAQPLLGTLLEAGDDAGERGTVIVLSEGLWRSRFGADPGALGQVVQIDGLSHEIVGVLPEKQAYPDRQTRAWVPLSIPQATPATLTMFGAVGRLRPGVSLEQAASEGTARAQSAPEPIEMLMKAVYGGTGDVSVSVTSLHQARTAERRPMLLVFLGAVGLLLVTAIANVASLLLARATTRSRELAIRAALGAGRIRVARQVLAESAWLGALGGPRGWPLPGCCTGPFPYC